MGPAGRAARVGKATRAAGGMQVNRGRPGAWPSSVSSRSRPALAHRGLRLPLLKNPEDLTAGQAASLGALRSSGAALWRGYLLKEALRAVFHGDPAGVCLARFLSAHWHVGIDVVASAHADRAA